MSGTWLETQATLFQTVSSNQCNTLQELLPQKWRIWSPCGSCNKWRVCVCVCGRGVTFYQQGCPMRPSDFQKAFFGSFFPTPPFLFWQASLAVACSLAPRPIPYMSSLITCRCLNLDQVFEMFAQSGNNRVLIWLWRWTNNGHLKNTMSPLQLCEVVSRAGFNGNEVFDILLSQCQFIWKHWLCMLCRGGGLIFKNYLKSTSSP